MAVTAILEEKKGSSCIAEELTDPPVETGSQLEQEQQSLWGLGEGPETDVGRDFTSSPNGSSVKFLI